MKVENPAAFRFIMQDDVYLLNADKLSLAETPQPVADIPAIEAEPVTEPVAVQIPEPVIKTQKTTFNYLGKNQKQFLVLAFYPAHDVMHEGHFTALESTFKRKELGIDDIAIVNLAQNEGATFEQLTAQFSPKKVLVLGQDAVPPGLQITAFNQLQTTSTIAILQTFSFGEMMTSNDNKKAFWDQVKNF
ncbi:MAG: hypothetical protein EOP54_24200 [Sphingobacteriales bacterium]|nr:MAG: hypothetical protein EOP54_24200 [Sphingobacteriales bacterium]